MLFNKPAIKLTTTTNYTLRTWIDVENIENNWEGIG